MEQVKWLVNLPLTSCMWSFLPTVLVLWNGVYLVLLSDDGTEGLLAEREGVALTTVDGGIFVTVDGVGCGGWTNSSLHGVDVFGSHGRTTSPPVLGSSGSGFRQDTGRNTAGGGWAGNGGGCTSAKMTLNSTLGVCRACLNISCALQHRPRTAIYTPRHPWTAGQLIYIHLYSPESWYMSQQQVGQ